MPQRGDTEIHSTATLLRCQVRRLRLRRGEVNLDVVWGYGRRFYYELLFRDQRSGVFQLADSGLSCPQRIDRLLLVPAIAVLTSNLQGYALSRAGLRRKVDPHWKRGEPCAQHGDIGNTEASAALALLGADQFETPIDASSPGQWWRNPPAQLGAYAAAL